MYSILALACLLSCAAAKPTVSPVQARDATCGINGYDKGTPASFYISDAPADITSSGCASLCGSKQGCLSFAYGGGNCLLYAAAAVGNINVSPSSPYVFNDLACVSGAGTTDSPSSSSTIPVAASSGDAHASGTGDSQAFLATTVTAPGSVTTVTQTPAAATVTATTTLPASTVTQTLPAATVTQTLPAVTKSATVTQTLPAVTATTTLTLPAVTKSATVTLPAVTSTKTVTVKCAAFGILCTTST